MCYINRKTYAMKCTFFMFTFSTDCRKLISNSFIDGDTNLNQIAYISICNGEALYMCILVRLMVF